MFHLWGDNNDYQIIKGKIAQDFPILPKLPRLLLTPVANLPPVSTTIAKLVAKFAAGVVDTGGNFAAGIVDTGGAL
jgi:hypothetical protein